ncbi:hypothetical protein V5O48_009431 [Marasmius crinis-equi]|uniref:Uncharacterized protein n=1 Tax=Marasmius crinis-equi TaxID=585013 RepID=A0ABR3FBB0_9AGAR
MINQLQLKAAIENYKETHDLKTTADVFHKLQDANITESSFLHHAAQAANHMRNAMVKEILTQEIHLVCDTIGRFRKDDKLGAMVMDIIIPAVARMRAKISSSFSTLFSAQLLKDFKLLARLDLSDIKTSDRFFNKLQTNTWLSPWNYDTWRSCLDDMSPTNIDLDQAIRTHLGKRKAEDSVNLDSLCKRPQLSLEEAAYQVLASDIANFDPLDSLGRLSSEDVHTIRTNFDSALEQNKYKMAGKSMKERLPFPDACQEDAKQATVPKPLDDFKSIIVDLLKDGYRKNNKHYVVLDPELTDKNVRVLDEHEKILTFLLSRLPEKLRLHLIGKLKVLFDGALREVDTEQEGNPDFESIHLSYWNRYTTRGDGAPEDADPQLLRRVGVPRMNFQSTLPCLLKETMEFQREWELLQEIMKPVFEWVGNQVKKYFLEEASHIQMFVDLLPGDAYSPIHPFRGIVINFNIASTFHRDPKDEQICLVMCISDCVAGELVLYEPGIVLKLRCGNTVIFRSTEISHFNLHFVGERASFVMSTDRAGKAWAKDRNGWAVKGARKGIIEDAIATDIVSKQRS